MDIMQTIKQIDYDINLAKNLAPGQVLYVHESVSTKSYSSSIRKQTSDTKKMLEEFYTQLGLLCTETRYGKVLKNNEEMNYVKNLFIKYIENPIFLNYLLKIKEFDENTFRHMIDVFTLGSLFAKKEGISNVEDIAAGYLFHDVWKLFIPINILRKKGRLTNKEFLILQEHIKEGYDILRKIGFEKVAYLAEFHHERSNTERVKSVDQPKDLQILRLIDRYSDITLGRQFKDIVAATYAIGILYNDLPLYSRELLDRFIDFIGIYPENAVVLLTDGTQAIIENVNSHYPLSPEVKLFNEDHNKLLPIDLCVNIQKLLFYHVNIPKDLFSKVTNFLLSDDYIRMESENSKLKSHYQKFEWFTHIYLPIFQVHFIYKTQNTFSNLKIQQSCEKLLKLVDEALLEFRLSGEEREMTLIIINGQWKSPYLYKLFEGLLFSDNIYSHTIINSLNNSEIESMINSFHIKNLIILGKPLDFDTSEYTTTYHLTELEIETFLSKFVCTNLHKVKLETELDKYRLGY